MNERLRLAVDEQGKVAQFGYWSNEGVTLDGTSGSVQTAVFTDGAKVRLNSEGFADCYVATGVNPTAVARANGMTLVNGTDHTIVKAGEKIAVIGGVLNIVPVMK